MSRTSTADLADFLRQTGPDPVLPSHPTTPSLSKKRSLFSRKKKTPLATAALFLSKQPAAPPLVSPLYEAKTLESGQTFYVIPTPSKPPQPPKPPASNAGLLTPPSTADRDRAAPFPESPSPSRRPVSLQAEQTSAPTPSFGTPSPISTPELTPHRPTFGLPSDVRPITPTACRGLLFPAPPPAVQPPRTPFTPGRSKFTTTAESEEKRAQDEVRRELENVLGIELDLEDHELQAPSVKTPSTKSRSPTVKSSLSSMSSRSHHCSLPSKLPSNVEPPSADSQIALLKATSHLQRTRMDEMASYYLGCAQKWDDERESYERKIKELELRLMDMQRALDSKDTALNGLKWLLSNGHSTSSSSFHPSPSAPEKLPLVSDEVPKLRRVSTMPRLGSVPPSTSSTPITSPRQSVVGPIASRRASADCIALAHRKSKTFQDIKEKLEELELEQILNTTLVSKRSRRRLPSSNASTIRASRTPDLPELRWSGASSDGTAPPTVRPQPRTPRRPTSWNVSCWETPRHTTARRSVVELAPDTIPEHAPPEAAGYSLLGASHSLGDLTRKGLDR